MKVWNQVEVAPEKELYKPATGEGNSRTYIIRGILARIAGFVKESYG